MSSLLSWSLASFLILELRSIPLKDDSCLPFCHKWERLASDASILQIISGDCIEFLPDSPSQVSQPPNSVPRNYVSLVNKKIKSLLDKGVIVPCDHEPGEFI